MVFSEGFENVSKERKWSKIAVHMGYPPNKGVGTILKMHYERLLYPFDVFKLGKTPESDPVVRIFVFIFVYSVYILILYRNWNQTKDRIQIKKTKITSRMVS